jgi:uncharacterized membrane protein YphA (DoxX/SURF4 family)
MDGFWDWSFDAKFGVLIAAAFAIWAVYGYIRYGLGDKDDSDVDGGGANVGRAGLDAVVGVGGCLAILVLIWLLLVGLLLLFGE